MEPGPFVGNGNGVDAHLSISHDGEIPEVVIRRLPIYARTLDELIEHGIRTISSNDLADRNGDTAAQRTADMLVAGNVAAILNYAPVVLQVPDHVCVRDIDPIAQLQSMTYYLDKTYHRVGTSDMAADD